MVVSVMFDFGFAKMFYMAIFEKYFYHKDIWFAATDSYIFFYHIVLSFSFDSFTSLFITFSLLISAVILLCNSFVLILCSHTTYTAYSEELLTFMLFELFYNS